jgi:hypothetical protein
MDYDELYVYKTSPYLSDSDSDGFDDNTEILSNHNPNCPEGKDCNVSIASTVEDSAQDSSNDILSGLLGMDSSSISDLSFDSVDEITNYFSQMSVDQVRSLLISQGIPKATVDQMSDQEVTDLLQSALTEAESSGEFDSLITSTQTETSTETDSADSTGQIIE